jgi:hypothetical protein
MRICKTHRYMQQVIRDEGKYGWTSFRERLHGEYVAILGNSRFSPRAARVPGVVIFRNQRSDPCGTCPVGNRGLRMVRVKMRQ